MQSYRQTKEGEYLELKERFSDFLEKYNQAMKKFASHRFRNLAGREMSQSVESLTLSSDEESTT